MGSHHFKISGAKPVIAFAAETQDLLGMSLSLNDMHLACTNRLAKLLGGLHQPGLDSDLSLQFSLERGWPWPLDILNEDPKEDPKEGSIS